VNFNQLKILFCSILITVFGCSNSIGSGDDIIVNDLYFDFDKTTGKIFIQLDVLNSTDYSIDSVFINMEYASNPNQFKEKFYLSDNGVNGDQIPGNGIFSMLSDELNLSSVPQTIDNVIMADYFILDSLDTDTLYVDLAISGDLYNLNYSIVLDSGLIYTGSQSVSVDNSKIEYYIDRDLMCIDNQITDDCDRECIIDNSDNILEITSNGYTSDPTWVIYDYDRIVNDYIIYSTSIPMRPTSDCGGTGYAFFRFDLINLDSQEISSSLESQLTIAGCGDGWCTPDLEDIENCFQDCGR